MRQIKHIAVGTDRSLTATPAVDLAAEMANQYGAELDIIQVLLPGQPPGTEAGQAEAMRASQAAEELRELAAGLARPRGHARVIVDADPAMAIVRAAEEAGADLLVVGNVGMAGRREFLLGNVPNRVSHNARCSVLIVNTTTTDARGAPTRGFDARTGSVMAAPDGEPTDAALIGRAARNGAIMAKHRDQRPQPSKPSVAVAITPGHAATVTHERPPPATGHQARQAHQGDVPTSCIDTQNVFLCRSGRGGVRPWP